MILSLVHDYFLSSHTLCIEIHFLWKQTFKNSSNLISETMSLGLWMSLLLKLNILYTRP